MGDEQEVDSVKALAERYAATAPLVGETRAKLRDLLREQRQIIREMRSHGLSQEDVAKILGVSQQAISKRARRPAKGDTTE